LRPLHIANTKKWLDLAQSSPTISCEISEILEKRIPKTTIWRDLRFEFFDIQQFNIQYSGVFCHLLSPPGTVESQLIFRLFVNP